MSGNRSASAVDPSADIDGRYDECDFPHMTDRKDRVEITTPTLRQNRRVGVLILVSAAVLLITRATHGNELVDDLPYPFLAIAWTLGLAIGLLFVFRARAHFAAQVWRGYIAFIAAPVFSVLGASYVARLAYEAIGFVGKSPTEIRRFVPIVNMSSGKGGTNAVVKIDPTSREIWVRVTSATYDRMDAFRHPYRDCLDLVIQTGRYGIRRMVLPNWFEDAVNFDHFSACPSQSGLLADGS